MSRATPLTVWSRRPPAAAWVIEHGRGISAALAAVADLALPRVCGGCGAPETPWCPECEQGSARLAFAGGPRLVRPEPCPRGLPRVWSGGPYGGPVRAALVSFKDGDRRDLSRVLAPVLAAAICRAVGLDEAMAAVLRSGNGPILAVPVPSARAAVRRRGDAPLVSLLDAALRLGSLAGCDLVAAPVLRLARRVADQAGLDHRQRAANLDHAMAVRSGWAGSVDRAACLLVDDVLTTGATLVEAARVLHAAGAGHVAAVTVAATQRRVIPAGRGARRELTGRLALRLL